MNNTLVYSFSIFGNFTIITNNIVNIVKKFPNFEKNVQNQMNGMNGVVFQTYILKRPQESINVGPTRIDYSYNVDFDDNNVKKNEEMISLVKLNLEKVLHGYEYSINRIALNSSYFFEDSSNRLFKLLLSEKASSLVNSDSTEFNLRFNSPTIISGRKFNNITMFSHGGIQNRTDFTSKKGLLLQNDLNSAIGSFNENNQVDLTISLFGKMFSLVVENIKSISEELKNG